MSPVAVSFDQMPSRTPFSPSRSALRLDPFYDELWNDSTQASWLSRQHAERSIAAGLGKLPKHLAATPDDAWTRLVAKPSWDTKLDALAACDVWRTVTSEQLAAITGHDGLASGKHRVSGDLFAAGLVEVGVFADAMKRGARADRATLFRPGRPGPSHERLLNLMTWPEWVSVTGGTDFEHTRQFDRHNLIGTELALRVSEFCRVGGVLGEKLSIIDDLGNAALGAVRPDSQRSADTTVVRRDGLRIAVEVTASQGKTLEAKIDRWAKTLAKARTNDSGLVVVFVVAGRAGGNNSSGKLVRKVKQAVSKAARLNPGHPDDLTSARMMVVSWEDWFPERLSASAAFTSLRAERPTGDDVNPWRPVDLLDEKQLQFRDTTGQATVVLRNLSGLRSTPHWLRERGVADELWPTALRRAGFFSVPQLSGLTAAGTERLPLGSAVGTVAAAQLPKRLLLNR